MIFFNVDLSKQCDHHICSKPLLWAWAFLLKRLQLMNTTFNPHEVWSKCTVHNSEEACTFWLMSAHSWRYEIK
uniref:Uncharacterized protein n=1 Tax=Anguilla anguilla TaxID=7936 RepID=A0A0E9WEC6_ANGAN